MCFTIYSCGACISATRTASFCRIIGTLLVFNAYHVLRTRSSLILNTYTDQRRSKVVVLLFGGVRFFSRMYFSLFEMHSVTSAGTTTKCWLKCKTFFEYLSEKNFSPFTEKSRISLNRFYIEMKRKDLHYPTELFAGNIRLFYNKRHNQVGVRTFSIPF